ncbi:hypothetical protein L226DRAFT_535581 [Lentinus tigrinus ALCF2SS1-7]|nr:hypothetical protein L226DRAFT_535581 [Lentinus tigrinus ALCF2SS1-7]
MYDAAFVPPNGPQEFTSQHSSLEASFGDNMHVHHAMQGQIPPSEPQQHAGSGVQFVGAYDPQLLEYNQPPSLPSYPAYSGMTETQTYHTQYAQEAQVGSIPQQPVPDPTMDAAWNMWSNAPSFYG